MVGEGHYVGILVMGADVSSLSWLLKPIGDREVAYMEKHHRNTYIVQCALCNEHCARSQYSRHRSMIPFSVFCQDIY